MDNSKCAGLPVFENKIHAAAIPREKGLQRTPDSAIQCFAPACFLDWGLERGFPIDPKTHSATLYDSGNGSFSARTPGTTSKAVVSILAHFEESKDRHVYIHDAAVTQNQLIEMVKKD